MESGTIASEITAGKMAQWRAKSGAGNGSYWHNGERNDLLSGTMAPETDSYSLARYQRNDWHYIMKMGGTMASELSKHGT